MPDMKNVIKGLNNIGREIVNTIGHGEAVPYLRTIDEAVALLKEQEAVEQRIDEYGNKRCGSENSQLYNYALKELTMAFPETQLEKDVPDDNADLMQRSVCENILDLVKLFCDQNHSGMSAAYTLNLATRLLNYHPIKPLTGDDDEWGESDGSPKNTQQNRRCSHVFRYNFDNSTAHDIHGRIFSDDGGKTFYTSVNSFVPVTFPYYPPDQPEKTILKQ